MKKIGFIGGYDKTDLIIYISKLLAVNDLKVLIIDATILQKTRYTIPCIEPSVRYITTFEDIDIAIGFESLKEIEQYTGTQSFDYDIVFVDVDNNENFEGFEMKTAEKNYFVTAFDNYSLKKGLETIGKSEDKIKLKKILFSKDMDKTEDEYLNFISFYYGIQWEKEKIYFPFEMGDNSIIIENQRNARISFKELSQQYKDGMLEIITEITPEIKLGNVKKMLRNI